jgi:hypothetical protein
MGLVGIRKGWFSQYWVENNTYLQQQYAPIHGVAVVWSWHARAKQGMAERNLFQSYISIPEV